jgi:hypothetical protein
MNDDVFLIDFPVWIIRDPSRGTAAVMRTEFPDETVVVAVFTSSDLANTYLESLQDAPEGYAAVPVENGLAFFGLVILLEEQGVTHVAIDPRPSRAYPVADLHKDLAKWLR